MAVKVDDPRDVQSAYDERFNQIAQAEYDDEFNKIAAAEQAGSGASAEYSGAGNDLGEATRSAEQTPGSWENNTTKRDSAGTPGGIRGALQKGKVLFKKKGATALIIALLGGGGLVPFLSAGSLPFAIVGNINSKSGLLGLGQYNQDFSNFKMFGPNKASVQNGAKGKLSGMTSGEVAQLKENGVTFKDEKINPITKKRTFTAVKYQDGPWINAGKDFSTELRKNPAFRKAMVYTKVSALSSLWKANKNTAAQSVKSLLRINTNPDISGKDTKERNKKMLAASTEGSSSSLDGRTNNLDENNKNPNGEAAGIAGKAQDEINANKAAFAEGNIDNKFAAASDMGNMGPQLNREALDVVSETSGVGSKIWSFVNVLDPLDMICTTYQIAHTAELVARGVALMNIVRFAMSMKVVIERAKAGDDDGESVKYLMEMIQQKDPETGRSFDMTSYATLLFTGKLSSEPSAVSAFGGQAMVALMMGMHALHTVAGAGDAGQGRANLRTGCNLATNLGVQIVATVGATFFTGGAIKGGVESIKLGLKSVRTKLVEAVVSKFGKEAIKKVSEDIAEQGTLKYFARNAWKGFKGAWTSFNGIDKAGFLLVAVSTFGMPYIVDALSGGNIAGYLKNGVSAFDALGTGNDRYEYLAGVGAGGTVATYGTSTLYAKTKEEYEQQYVADMQYDAKDTPLDIQNPYSTLGAAMFNIQKLVGISASTDILSTLKSVATLPLRLPSMGAASADDAEPTAEAIGEQIGDPFSKENKIALTVTGNPQLQFNKTMTTEEFIDTFVDSSDPQVSYDGDDEETGEPKFSIIPATDLDEYAKKCHDPANAEIDPEYSDADFSYVDECINNANQQFDDALRFINQLSPDAATSAASTPSEGAVSTGEFAWPFGEDDYKKNKADYLSPHIQTGTAWGSDNMGTTNKGAYIASDIGKSVGTPVYAMFSGKVTSINLCGANDGVAIKSDINGKTLGIAYMHGDNQRFKVGDTVNAGDVIMDVGTRGCNVFGAHLHIGIAYDGEYLCPQDVFLAAEAGATTFDFSGMVKKAASRCGRS